MLEAQSFGSENYSGKQNLVDIEAGIIVQLDGTERPFIQKFGRSLRAEDPHQYIFYYKNTRDEEYLENILEDLDESFIDEINLDEYVKQIHS